MDDDDFQHFEQMPDHLKYLDFGFKTKLTFHISGRNLLPEVLKPFKMIITGEFLKYTCPLSVKLQVDKNDIERILKLTAEVSCGNNFYVTTSRYSQRHWIC